MIRRNPMKNETAVFYYIRMSAARVFLFTAIPDNNEKRRVKSVSNFDVRPHYYIPRVLRLASIIMQMPYSTLASPLVPFHDTYVHISAPLRHYTHILSSCPWPAAPQETSPKVRARACALLRHKYVVIRARTLRVNRACF